MLSSYRSGLRARVADVARSRLIILAAYAVACLALRAGGIAISGTLLAVIGLWLVLAWGLLRVTARVQGERGLIALQSGALLADVALITFAYHHSAGGRWIGPVLYGLVIIAAMATLPRTRATVVSMAAIAAYAFLQLGLARGVIPENDLLGLPPLRGNLRHGVAAAVLGGLALLLLAAAQRSLIQAIQRSEERYRLLLATATDLIFTLDGRGRFRCVNDATLAASGYPAGRILDAHFGDFVYPPDLATVQAHFDATLRGEPRQYEMRYTRADGAVRWLSVTNSPIRESGRVVGALGIARDVTSRREAEGRIAAQHRLGRILAGTTSFEDAAPRLLEELSESLGFEIAALWRVEHASGALAGIRSWHAPESRREQASRLARDDGGVARDLAQRVLESGEADWRHGPDAASLALGEPRRTTFAFPVRYRGRTFAVVELFSGDERPIDAAVLQLAELIGGQLGQAIEREQLQADLARASTMETMGRLVSGVAHELNNPLTAVLGFAEQLLEGERTSEDREALAVIHQQARRSRAIVRDLLTVVRKAEPRAHEAVELGAFLESLGRTLRPQIEALGASLRIATPERLPRIVIDPVGIEQVITNLAINAGQATGAGGCVTITARSREGTCEITVDDDGPGITPEHMPRLFEPFFTTKRAGEGTGLGLPVSLGIVERHGGTLIAANRARAEGGGARLTVTLPCSAPADGAEGPNAATPAQCSVEPTSAAASPATVAPRVLVIDDEEVIRHAVRRWFTRRGWDVREACDGAEALAILRESGRDAPPPFDVVLCDLRMPGMTGMELHEQLARERPELLPRIIFSTGDVASPDSALFLAETRCRVLEKPFELDHLGETVENVRRTALCG